MFSNYAFFKKEDYLQDEYFIEYIKKPSRESIDFFEKLRLKYSDANSEMLAAKEAILNLNGALKPSHDKNEKSIIWNGISNVINLSRFHFKIWYGAAAAIVLIIISFSFFYLIKPSQSESYISFSKKSESEFNHFVNTTNSEILITLNDGSTVKLWPKAKLKSLKKFTNNIREVYLEGKAFFEIQKDSKRPFLVYTNDIVTKVLGTSFLVEQSNQTKVSVISGKVAVYLNKPKSLENKNTLLLEPNQMVENKNDFLIKSLVPEPRPLISKIDLKAFVYTEAKLELILLKLQDIYGVNIVYDKDQIQHCTLTTSMTEESLFEKLDVICTALNGSYTIIDSKIILQITSCEP